MLDRLTVHSSLRRFPGGDACLDHLTQVRFGRRHDCRDCGVATSTGIRKHRRRATASRSFA